MKPSFFLHHDLGALRRLTLAGVAAGILATTLSACGGDDSPATSINRSTASASRHALLIDLDGATYAAVQRGIATGTLPNLARLQVQLAYSGGVFGAPSQQPSLDTPGWATLLTGAWADRHQVASDVAGQAMKSSTVFEMARTANTGLNGAVVGSAGLAGLLAPIYNANALDTLTDCSGNATADSCVTNGALQMIASNYGVVVAQYHTAVDAAINYGQNAAQYAATLAKLDTAVGALVAETAKAPNNAWLVMVTGNHGLGSNSQNDGLPLVPEATTFVGMNQPANNGTAGVNATVPTTLAGLYAYASIADVTPTMLAWVNAQPSAANYAMDGGQLVNSQPVWQLSTITNNADLANPSIALNWSAPSSGEISLLRNGETIAAGLPAGTTTYTDTAGQLTSVYTSKGTYAPNYTVVAGNAARAILSSFSYTPPPPPVPLATTLKNSLVVYYPFSSTLPAADAMGNSTLAPWAAGADGGTVVPSPFGGGALQVDMHAVDGTNGLNGYRLMPNAGSDVTAGSSSFTIGFWFNAGCFPLGVANSANVVAPMTASTVGANHTYPIFGNKNYISGIRAGVEIAANSGDPTGASSGCHLIFNIGDGTNRADPAGGQGKGLGLAYTANKWIYVAMAVDTTAKTVTGYVFDPVNGNESASTSTGSVNVASLVGLANGFGMAEDGTGKMSLTICGNPQGSALPGLSSGTYTATTCGQLPPITMAFSDVAMWNRAVSAADLATIYQSRKPLSTLLP